LAGVLRWVITLVFAAGLLILLANNASARARAQHSPDSSSHNLHLKGFNRNNIFRLQVINNGNDILCKRRN
jgi:hypothetical protein